MDQNFIMILILQVIVRIYQNKYKNHPSGWLSYVSVILVLLLVDCKIKVNELYF